MDRQTALELLQEYTQKEGLLKHAYAVEAAMCAYARKFNQDEWSAIRITIDCV